MKLLLVRHLWGVDLSKGCGPYIEKWREAGYRALESSPRMVPDAGELRRTLKNEGLAWVPQIFSHMQNGGGNVALHLSTLREQVEECLDADCLFFNAQSGSDAWSIDEAEDFYGAARDLEAKLGIVLSHETHRSRYFGNPWNTCRLLERIPDIKLTADFSHWVCVAERLLADAAPALARVASQCHHIHARVGYEQGPQVPDPRAPEWQIHLRTHEQWWDAIWSSQKARGVAQTTLTPEFGPPPYLHTLPFTQAPVADLAPICDWMAHREAQRFDAWSGANPYPGETRSSCAPRT
jgi:hypothetical protein